MLLSYKYGLYWPYAGATPMHAKQSRFIPARLKVRTRDGVEFIETSRVLREPELQAHCLEKRELERIMKILQKSGRPPKQPDPKSNPPPSSPPSPSSSRRRR